MRTVLPSAATSCTDLQQLLTLPLLAAAVAVAQQVSRRQAQADAVAAEYAALQQEHTNLENELLESRSQVQLLQAEVRVVYAAGPRRRILGWGCDTQHTQGGRLC